MDPTKPSRAGSDEARSGRARTLNIILRHIQDILASARTNTDINTTLQADHLQALARGAKKIAKHGVL